MLTRRTQLLLDEERYARVERRAAATNRSVGAVIREAIDRAFPSEAMTRAQAAEYFHTAPRLDISSPEDIRRELETMYDE
jgi:uncharacterized secreted protein with C-terminal beta-propeller domain